MSYFRLGSLAAVAVIVVLVIGCINADQSTDSFYDPASDSLHVLTVESNIVASADADKNYLRALWHNRGDLLPGIVSGDILSSNAMLRLSDHQMLTVSLGSMGAKPAVTTVDYSLNSIAIKPGVFFRGKDKNSLCYYQETVVPGAVVDAVLGQLQKALFAKLASSAGDEIRRRADGGPVVSWDDFRAVISTSAPAKESDAQKADRQFKSDPMHCLSDDSLRMLVMPPAQVKVGLARHGDKVTLTLALTPKDQQEAIKTLAMEKKSAPIDFDAAAGPGNAIRASSTLVALANICGGQPLLAGGDQAQPPAPPEWVNTFGAKIDATVTLDNLHDRFVKGTLPIDSAPTTDKTHSELFSVGR